MENQETTPRENAPTGNSASRIVIIIVVIGLAVLGWYFTKSKPAADGVSTTEELSTSTRMAILEESKDDVIEGLLRTKEVLASNDPERIREYILDKANRDERKQYEELSDEDLLNGVKLLNAQYMYFTQESLHATSTMWAVIKRNEVRVGVAVPNEGYAVVGVNKDGDEWY
jgi:hypothetical protein